MRAILPALESAHNIRVQSSLKLLVLSGEVLHLYLLDVLVKLLPKTAILNLYGSTEVSGDCTYFDCKRLPLILESEALSSVPIGLPISNCDVVVVGENAPNHGEIYVSGLCNAAGYFCDSSIMPLDHELLPQDSCFGCFSGKDKSRYYFKTGDLAKQLQSGDFVFLGRIDRTVKINGHRIALEEIESTLREHRDIVDAAVISCKGQGEVTLLQAYLITKQKVESADILKSSIRSWMISKLPLAMIPSHFFFTKSFPMSSTGKVDYMLLVSSTNSMAHVRNEIEEIPYSNLLQVIEKAFCDALMVEKISNNDNFFEMGGTSISAAHASYNLGIDMQFLYKFPSPLELQLALLEKERTPNLDSSKPCGRLFRNLDNTDADYPSKYLKTDSNSYMNSLGVCPKDGYFWDLSSIHMASTFSRCNKVVNGENVGNTLCQTVLSQKISRDQRGSMRELWKIHMESCVDASPLVVFTERDIHLFIGSHSHKFLCVNVQSGLVKWEIKLEGRIECSAAILDDFSQVVVGCYQGNIYFLDFLNGSICWTFQTCGEVKSQPLVDKFRHLVWCGSYDHNLYALDYRKHCCICKLPCGGSVFGSPAIDEVHDKLYVASTSGRLTAISIKALPFCNLWLQELGAPVFGSLSINSSNGDVICCLVNGHVVALDASGSIIWRGKTGGPIFAGPCISPALPSQVLICSRDGSIYSFELESGDLLWEHNVGDPIVSSAYVDENLLLVSDVSDLADRLVCVTSCSGSIHLLRINLESIGESNRLRKDAVQIFARMDLQGDIFSSPVMIAGTIFVGCRDDYVHCVEVEEEVTV